LDPVRELGTDQRVVVGEAANRDASVLDLREVPVGGVTARGPRHVAVGRLVALHLPTPGEGRERDDEAGRDRDRAVRGGSRQRRQAERAHDDDEREEHRAAVAPAPEARPLIGGDHRARGDEDRPPRADRAGGDRGQRDRWGEEAQVEREEERVAHRVRPRRTE